MSEKRLITIIRANRSPREYQEAFLSETDGFVDEMFQGAKVFLEEDAIQPTLAHLKEHGFEMHGQTWSFEDLRFWHLICSEKHVDGVLAKLDGIRKKAQISVKCTAQFTVEVQASAVASINDGA